MSWQMKGVGLLMRATRKRRFADPDGARQLLSEPKGDPEPSARTVRGLAVTHHEIAGYGAYAAVRPGLDRYQVPTVIYLHGGAFVSEIAPQHWQLIAQIAHGLDVAVLVPAYGLAPQHNAAQARELVATLIDRAEEDGRTAYLVGDSAGGNLALVAAQEAVAGGRRCLAGLTLIAPWLDLTMANPEIEALEPHDPWLARAALHEVARVWADGTPLDDPRVSPLFGEFAGLPPVDLWVGERDICLPDSQLLRDAIAEVGTVTYHQEPGALHVYPLLPTPEGKRARTELVAHIGRVLAA